MSVDQGSRRTHVYSWLTKRASQERVPFTDSKMTLNELRKDEVYFKLGDADTDYRSALSSSSSSFFPSFG